ncbi:hypothetical protein NE865_08365 [Phthorimaea operculella]|nr:hypothetical protein NE865_08365 [Phthorimaea operculella]
MELDMSTDQSPAHSGKNESVFSVDGETTPPNFVNTQKRVQYKEKTEESSSLELIAFKKEITDMISNFTNTHSQENKQISDSLNAIQQTNLKIEESLTTLKNQNEELFKKIAYLETQSKKDKEYIVLLEEKVEDLQRASRKACIQIKNVPKKKAETKEELTDMVLKLSENLQCDVEKKDIKDIFRIQGKKEEQQTSTIIVELNSTLQKTDFIKKCKIFNRQKQNQNKLQAKHLGLKTKEDTPIFVSEQLTSKAARLYFLARDLTNSKQYGFCWTSFGRVYVRKDERSPVILIKNEAQVQQLRQSA